MLLGVLAPTVAFLPAAPLSGAGRHVAPAGLQVSHVVDSRPG